MSADFPILIIRRLRDTSLASASTLGDIGVSTYRQDPREPDGAAATQKMVFLVHAAAGYRRKALRIGPKARQEKAAVARLSPLFMP